MQQNVLLTNVKCWECCQTCVPKRFGNELTQVSLHVVVKQHIIFVYHIQRNQTTLESWQQCTETQQSAHIVAEGAELIKILAKLHAIPHLWASETGKRIVLCMY